MNDTAEKLEDNIEESNEVLDKADFEVEIVDDTPEEDRVAKRKDEVTTEAKEVEDSDDGEAKNYSQNVQKRISQLKYEFHEERRAKEEELNN